MEKPTFDGARRGWVLVVDAVAALLHLDGVVPHLVEQVGAGGGAWDGADPALQPLAAFHPEPLLARQPVGSDPVLHPSGSSLISPKCTNPLNNTEETVFRRFGSVHLESLEV